VLRREPGLRRLALAVRGGGARLGVALQLARRGLVLAQLGQRRLLCRAREAPQLGLVLGARRGVFCSRALRLVARLGELGAVAKRAVHARLQLGAQRVGAALRLGSVARGLLGLALRLRRSRARAGKLRLPAERARKTKMREAR